MADELSDFLAALRLDSDARVAVMGIGNELNGDDAAGVLAARILKQQQEERGSLPRSSALLVIEAGPAPESFTGKVRRFAADVVLLIDAAELGDPPGTVHAFDWSAAQGLSASTHTLPPSMLAEFLSRELNCPVALIGIQPKSLELDAGLSDEAAQAAQRVAADIGAWFWGDSTEL